MNVAQENEACIILNPINRQIIPDLLGQRTIEDNERIQVEKKTTQLYEPKTTLPRRKSN